MRRASLISFCLLALVLPALGQGDSSLSSDEYARLGWPPAKGDWGPAEHLAVADKLRQAALANPKTLPRAKSEKSGEYFARLVEVRSLARFAGSKAPPLATLQALVQRFQAASLSFKAYQQADQTEPYDVELAQFASYLLRASGLALELANASKAQLDQKAPDYAKRIAGLEQMRSGVVTIVLGALQLHGELELKPADRQAFLKHLVAGLPKISQNVTESARDLLRGSVRQLAKERPGDDFVQAAATKMLATLGPSPSKKTARPTPIASTGLPYLLNREKGFRVAGLPPLSDFGVMVNFMALPRSADPRTEVVPHLMVAGGSERKTLEELEARHRKGSKVLSRTSRKLGKSEVVELELEKPLAGRKVRVKVLLTVHRGLPIQLRCTFPPSDSSALQPALKACFASLRLFDPDAPPDDLEAKGLLLIEPRLGFSVQAPGFRAALRTRATQVQFQGTTAGNHCLKLVTLESWAPRKFEEFYGERQQILAQQGFFTRGEQLDKQEGLSRLSYEFKGRRGAQSLFGRAFAVSRGADVLQTTVILMGGTEGDLEALFPKRELGTAIFAD